MYFQTYVVGHYQLEIDLLRIHEVEIGGLQMNEQYVHYNMVRTFGEQLVP